jgi:ethanolamine ammonia-lyase small subunit
MSDFYDFLKTFTSARIGLGRSGCGVPTKQSLKFQQDFALAKDAIYEFADIENLAQQIWNNRNDIIQVHSRAKNREEYLLRPDYGRRINKEHLQLITNRHGKYDVCLIIGDGLSGTAINKHLSGFLNLLLPELSQKYQLAPLVTVRQARVAVADEIGQALGARLTIIVLGERPGLTSPDSLGLYLTYQPQTGKTDESRNCISNIRPGGLSFEIATAKCLYLVSEALRLQISGVKLKDTYQQLPDSEIRKKS